MIKTRVTELFDIHHPIVCGAMHRLCIAEFCAAVSEAGGLGNLTASNYKGKKDLRQAIRKVKKLTKNPFAVNVTMLPAREIGEGDYRNYFDAILEEDVPVVDTSGVPLDRFADGSYMEKLKSAGIKTIHKVGSVAHAMHAERAGYDAVIVLGVEGGGHPHRDSVATTILTPSVAESVHIPVITAGGMVTGRSLAAALCLGAEGIMMASRFICTVECKAHPHAKEELTKRKENETILYGNRIGLQARALLNESVTHAVKIESEGGSLEDMMPYITGKHGPEIWERGNMKVGSIHVGQSIGLIKEIISCKNLMSEIIREAEGIFHDNIKKLNNRTLKKE